MSKRIFMRYSSAANLQWNYKQVLLFKVDEEKKFISKYVDLTAKDTWVMDAASNARISNCPPGTRAIVNLNKVNDIRYINKYFESVNAKLSKGDLFIGRFETFTARKERMRINKIPVLRTVYFLIEFIFMRAFPKVKGLHKIYFAVTKGKGRLLSKAEALGRMVCCGFEIIDLKEISGLIYFVIKKVKAPAFDMKPSYGLIYKMPRVGKNGKKFGVYKFRTMHPYSEYLQDYVIKINGYSSIGKPADDFRLTPWGRFMRKYWLDELPQLINVMKGEMNLVGVRPLSDRFLAEYPTELKQRRFKYKPGCFPPYVALLKQGVEQYIESERIYFDDKEKHPLTTDIIYLFKAVRNIITNKIKSS